MGAVMKLPEFPDAAFVDVEGDNSVSGKSKCNRNRQSNVTKPYDRYDPLLRHS